MQNFKHFSRAAPKRQQSFPISIFIAAKKPKTVAKGDDTEREGKGKAGGIAARFLGNNFISKALDSRLATFPFPFPLSTFHLFLIRMRIRWQLEWNFE